MTKKTWVRKGAKISNRYNQVLHLNNILQSTSLGNSCSKYENHLIKMNKESTVRASVTDKDTTGAHLLHKYLKKSPLGHHETISTDNRRRQLNLI